MRHGTLFPVLLFALTAGGAAACAQTASAPPAAAPDGSRLALGDSCYTTTVPAGGTAKAIGVTFQSLRATEVGGVPALAIVVHQHMADGSFDMRDSFLLRRADLAPIRLDSERGGQPHVHVEYAKDRVTGWKMVKGVKQPIDVVFDGPVWDANLWGVTFAALPLHAGASFRLPTYQYDNGKGSFLVEVEGETTVTTADGPVAAWVLKAGTKPEELIRYTVAKAPARELGYEAGPMAQQPGGDCSGIG